MPASDPERLRFEIIAHLRAAADAAAELPAFIPASIRGRGAAGFDELYRPPRRLVVMREVGADWITPEDRVESEVRNELRGFDATGPVYLAWRGCEVTEARRMVLIGEPGAGKSWLLRGELRRLATEGAESLESGHVPAEAVILPLLAPLPSLSATTEPLEEELLSSAGFRSGTSLHSWARAQLKSGAFIVMLDGWDEVGDRSVIRSRIEKICRAYPRGRVLLTSRTMGPGASPLPEAQWLAVPPWDDWRILTFVRAWFGSEGGAGPLMARLDRDDRLRVAARSPLVLTLLCLVEQAEPGAVISSRAALLERCVCALVESAPAPAGLGAVETELPGLLARAAYRLFISPQKVLTDLGVASACESTCHVTMTPESGHKIVSWLLRIGLLKRQGAGRLAFLHQSLFECLAARGLAAEPDWLVVATDRAESPRWRGLLVSLAGLLGPRADELIGGLRVRGRGDLFRRGLELAVEAIAEAQQTVSREAVHRVCVDVLRWCERPAPELRFWFPIIERMIESLAGSPLGHSELQNAYRSNPPSPSLGWLLVQRVLRQRQRLDPIAALVQRALHQRRSTEALLLLSREKQAKECELAAAGLADRGDLRSLTALIELSGDPEARVRRAAAISLGWHAAEPAVDALLVLSRDSDLDTRQSAVEALGRRGDPRGIEPALALLRDSGLHAGIAIEALGQMRAVEAVDPLIHRIALQPALDRYGRTTRNLMSLLLPAELPLAVDSLGRIGDPRALPALRELVGAKSFGVEDNALRAIARIGHPRAMEILLELATAPNACSLGMIEALATAGDEHTVEILVEWAIDHRQHERLRAEAAETLGRLGSTAIPHVLLFLRGEVVSPRVRAAAAHAAGELAYEEAREVLAQMLHAPEGEVRLEAARSLALLGDRRAVPELLRWLAFRRPKVRATAVKALGRVGSESEVSALLAARSDSDSEVRRAVLSALLEIGEREEIPIREGAGSPFGRARHRIEVAWSEAGEEPVAYPTKRRRKRLAR